MAEDSKIEWTDHTHNEWEGCQHAGPGCDNCYAEARNTRFGGGVAVNWGPGAPRRLTSEKNRAKPKKWNAAHDEFFAKHGRRQRVFCSSLADVFDNAVDPAWRAGLFDTIAQTPNLDWLLLTKRIGNVQRLSQEAFDRLGWMERTNGTMPPNVWIGATIVNREEMLRDGPKLQLVPARVRFWSVEPMLGDLGDIPLELMPDWGICGGETGRGARPMHPTWPRNMRDQFAAAGRPWLFKQWGDWHTAAVRTSDGAAVFRQFDSFQHWVNKAQTWVNGGICLDRHGSELKIGADFMRARDAGAFPATIMHKVGKEAAGRLLDGVEHNGYPVVDHA